MGVQAHRSLIVRPKNSQPNAAAFFLSTASRSWNRFTDYREL
jgi:hypothetical protein